ncbi:hypothetical protein PtA15_18A335 [Puccinia triticina]|uniref:Uncharacterized protein n=1 Tax=Puccinia triticina TaxID=208348 RepID=A0ABY7D9B2_9BASI|nr:uncharacterized protein PtA15_18A335 [Puccinia triticina]WAQ93277.1 hypothetical protein PtA15_18A335 [Puccinia triticina]WAR63266.1 hypothetical protein PtB15_18B348 [Puccinia triticina]
MEEHKLAFEKIHQAIREDDLWLAAWWMSKFVKKGYRLTHEQLERLELERKYCNNNAIDLAMALDRLAGRNAGFDFDEWLKKGTPFQTIANASLKNWQNGPKAKRLQTEIDTYSCAAGYIEAIISMGTINQADKLKVDSEWVEVIEMEAMGATPSVENSNS